MPRFGQNPLRWGTTIRRPRRTTVALLNFIPTSDGYWSQSFDVLDLCLESLHQSVRTGTCDIMVFDNGSCPEARTVLEGLLQAHKIDYLFLCRENLGKAGAWNSMFSAAPGEIVAYADADVFFLPGWLEASLEVLRAFPEAGMVTAQPARRGLKYCSATLAGAKDDPSVTTQEGDLIPAEYLDACRRGLGRSRREYEDIIAGQRDTILTRKGVSAYVSADHFQFVAPKGVLVSLLPLRVTRPLSGDDDYQLDSGVNAAGRWRLSTARYLVHHIGNRMPETLAEYGLSADSPVAFGPAAQKMERDARRRSAMNRHVRSLLKRVNSLTYRLLYGG